MHSTENFATSTRPRGSLFSVAGLRCLGLAIARTGTVLVCRRRARAHHTSGNRVSQVSNQIASEMLGFVKSHGLEGIIAKRADSVYEPGRRSGMWVKLRINLEIRLRDNHRHSIVHGLDYFIRICGDDCESQQLRSCFATLPLLPEPCECVGLIVL